MRFLNVFPEAGSFSSFSLLIVWSCILFLGANVKVLASFVAMSDTLVYFSFKFAVVSSVLYVLIVSDNIFVMSLIAFVVPFPVFIPRLFMNFFTSFLVMVSSSRIFKSSSSTIMLFASSALIPSLMFTLLPSLKRSFRFAPTFFKFFVL